MSCFICDFLNKDAARIAKPTTPTTKPAGFVTIRTSGHIPVANQAPKAEKDHGALTVLKVIAALERSPTVATPVVTSIVLASWLRASR